MPRNLECVAFNECLINRIHRLQNTMNTLNEYNIKVVFNYVLCLYIVVIYVNLHYPTRDMYSYLRLDTCVIPSINIVSLSTVIEWQLALASINEPNSDCCC